MYFATVYRLKRSWYASGAVVLMCQWFAPTKLRITFETEGPGKFSKEEIERVVVKNAEGQAMALNLPTKFVLTANHQVSTSFQSLS